MAFDPLVDDIERVAREAIESQEVAQEAELISTVEAMDDMRRLGLPGMDMEVPENSMEADDFEPMSDEDLATIIEAELSDGIGSEEDDQPTDRDMAWNYYLARPRGDEREGRSKVISTDLADMVEAILAQILPAFTSDLAVEFEADSEEDEATIAEESAYVNWVIQEKNNGFTLFYQLFKDALLTKNCVAKVTSESESVVDIQTHDNIPNQALEQAVGMLRQQVQAQGMEDVSVMLDQGEEVSSVRVRSRKRQQRIMVTPVPIERAVVNSDHGSISLQNARFVAHRDVVTAGDLLEMGVDEEVIEELPTSTNEDYGKELSRNQIYKESEREETEDKANRPIEVHDIAMVVDYDGDGYAERRRILYSANTILLNEEVTGSMWASGAPFIQPYRWLGISLYDKLKQVQDSKTDFLRQAHDNAKTANNARIGYVVGQVNQDDIFNSKPGGGIRMKRPDSIVPLDVPNVLPAIFQMLGYMDKVRTERAGASLDMQSQQLQVQNDTAHGTERLVSAKEQLASMVSRTLAETVVRDIYLLVHDEARRTITEQVPFKTSGGWQTANPSKWPRRDRVSLTVGLSQGERQRQASALLAIGSQQTNAMEKGLDGVLVDYSGVYKTLIDFAKMSGLSAPEQYWIDPESPESQQELARKQQERQQQQAQAQQTQQMMMQMQQSMLAMQEDTKRLKAAMDQQLGYDKLMEDRRQHTEEQATELTKLEVETAADLSQEQRENVAIMQR